MNIIKNKKVLIISGIVIMSLGITIKIGIDKLHDNGYEIVVFNKSETKEVKPIEKEDKYKKMSKDELNKALNNAIFKDDIKEAKILLDKGADYYYVAEDKINMFQRAFYLGNTELIDYMIKKGASVKSIKTSANCLYEEKTIVLFKKYGVDTSNTLNEYAKKNTPSDNGNPKINGFEILEHTGGDYITGKIKNTNDIGYSSVYININILDMNDNVISSTIDSINNLQVGQTWSFKAPVTVNQRYKYQIMSIKAYK